MHAIGIVPAQWDVPLREHVSGLFGQSSWRWVIEVFSRDLRNRLTGGPAAEVPVAEPTA